MAFDDDQVITGFCLVTDSGHCATSPLQRGSWHHDYAGNCGSVHRLEHVSGRV